jgi:uncharacterized protein with beta-barrel porin domain
LYDKAKRSFFEILLNWFEMIRRFFSAFYKTNIIKIIFLGKECIMKKKGWIGFLIGIVFCLTMAMSSFVLADVTVSGGTESSMVDLEGINNGSVTPGSYTTVSGTTRNAYVTDTGAVNTSDSAAILTGETGWNVNVSGGGSLTGGDYGVLFDDDGNNPHLNGILTNYGSIYGGSAGALMNYGTITNYGSLTAGIGSGAHFASEGTGTATVTNYGTMSGGDNGLFFHNPSTGTTTAIVTNNSGGTISGYYNGVEFYSAGAGIATVTNSGTITGTDDGDGIYLYSDGALTTRIQNNAGGTIDGYWNGIDFESVGAGTVEITNAGTITGDWGNGAYLWSDGAMTATVTNTGTIQSNDDYGYCDGDYCSALYIGSDVGTGTATVTNSGLISAYGDGVGIEYLDTATVTNNAGGKIESDYYNGVYTYEVGTVTINNSGTIAAYNNDDDDDDYPAIYIGYGDTAMVNNNTGGRIEAGYGEGVYIEYMNTATVNNYGTIENDEDGADEAVYIYEVGTVTINNYAGGLISSTHEDGDDGIYIENAGTATINNYGKIYSGCETVVHFDDVDTVTLNNYAGGLIQAREEEAVEIYDAVTATVNNYGRIEGIDQAVYIEDTETATINNYAGGTILSYESNAIDYNGESLGTGKVTVNNSGTIQAYGEYDDDDDSDAIHIGYADTAKVTNNAGGSILSYNGNGIFMEYIGGPSTAEVINSGLIQAYYDGVYIGYADTAKVTNNASGSIQSYNGRGIAMEYIGGSTTAEVINSGLIQAYGPHGDDGVGDAVYIGNSDVVKVTNNAGGLIQSMYGYGVGMEYIYGTADVTNSGTIQSYLSGVGIAMVQGAVTVTNNDTGVIQGGYNYSGGGMPPSGVAIFGVGTADVTNKGTIQGIYAGVSAYGAEGTAGVDETWDTADDVPGTIKVTNSGTIQGSYLGVGAGYADEVTVTNKAGGTIQQIGGPIDDDDDGYGVGIINAGTVTVENAGTISGYNDGVGIQYVGMADVTNTGIIQGVVHGVGIRDFSGSDGPDGLPDTEDDVLPAATVDNSGTIQANGPAVWIRADADGASVDVTNSGMISSTSDKGVYIRINGPNETTTLTNTATGVISGGIEMVVSNVYSTGEITNSGIITSNGDGISLTGYGEKTVTNEAGASIIGGYGIRVVNGPSQIFNYGTITGTDGTAIRVNRGGNEVTLGTGSVINGDIRANYNYSDNYMILDGEGTINANQMQQFGYLNKTGSGTWTLTGDMDYESSYDDNGHSITVEEGVLALGARGSVGGGVVTDSFTQNTGASLGYAVTATGSTGQLTVNGNADFGNGSIVVIPAAGTYAADTLYPTVLYVNGNITVNGEIVVDPTDPSWATVTSTAAFLRPSLLYNAGVYDLGLERLSFTSATTPGTASLGAALDGLYDTATGDLRTALDELILVSPGDVEKAFAGIGGGSYPALQLMSFNGLGKYLGVLNNHIGAGGAFASNQKSGFAWNGMQLAMSGNSMNDAAPILLAAAGNIGQTQIAAGNNWGFWLDGYASYGNRRSDEIISKYKQILFGGMLGFDVRVAPNLFLGISGGLSTTDLDFDDLQDKGNMDSYHGSIYLCYNGKPWYAEGVFTYAYNKYDMERFIGLIHEIAKGDFSGNEFNGYAEVGYKFDAGGVIIRPLAAFQVDYLTQQGFTETGSSLNLVVDDQSIGSYQSFLGLNINGPIKMGASAVLTPELRLKWAHEFSNDDHLISAKFAGGASDYFTVAAEDLSRDTFIAGLGLNLKFNKNLAAYVQYDAELNKDFVNHTGLVGLRVEW